ncbi:sensor histidine kinase [Paenibacillus lignilyticus]|uniref:Oxygen sensor histidine kinase NreB n=1 Tax=Paenibacillus lignilyticus TaxID=1172615 RepID=A0ABS5CEJ3_9BACL|nr:sensor histidine kinase [Paenibacillus lignilyticus]MBP3961821.1 sensor histidine kinase [Paenibacillus lignilyticus]MBP3963508.1 sensor histidine kinase [Paenibacillus lignilyticus]
MAIQIESERFLIEERNRIAEELHDRVSQHLFGIIYAIQSMKGDCNGMNDDRTQEQMQEIQEAALAASRELRASIYNLSSRESDKNDNASWISIVQSHLANQAKLNGVEIRFHAPNSDDRLSINHQKALYRMILEGVGNAIRHGASSRITIHLTVEPRIVKLSIEDNGRGFNPWLIKPSKPDSGFGLSNMRTLAASLGGKFGISTKQGSGTVIRVLLPITGVHKATGQTTKSG